ncbi:YbhB/YbcL family Raf kinase inhibitor-like protein [Occallatibacter savannae]|uniref:YbhB/YbcL family Raf kinase inhibitor-like protein n=1 Tax=Occallatibacter savannae TaxID=1002691 RepID=UPI000D69BD88|nr:YbhB/YbcL family Raf kinase inhibitor-like protein [Occallatibacter savannae]
MHIYEPILPFRHLHVSSGLLLRILLLLALLFAVPFLASCRHHDQAVAATSGAALTLSSEPLKGGTVPREFTCDGEDKSPPLTWTAPPAGTKSLALTVTDPDAPGGTFTHWVLFNLPANTIGLPEGVPKQGQLAHGGRQGNNDFAKVGYGGPCPPVGQTHRYIFTLYALDSVIDIPAGAPRDHVEPALQSHVLSKGELTARYGR